MEAAKLTRRDWTVISIFSSIGVLTFLTALSMGALDCRFDYEVVLGSRFYVMTCPVK